MGCDWYRNEEWNDNIEKAFFDRLNRSRGQFHKAQYLRIQAVCLEKEEPEVALRLLDLIISEYPEPSELALVYFQKAECYVSLSMLDNAVYWYRKSLDQESVYKNVKTDCYLNYSVFAVTFELEELYQEVKKILLSNTERLKFPVDRYRYHMSLSIIEWEQGDCLKAKEHAGLALDAISNEYSGFRYHSKVGLVGNPDNRIVNKLLEILHS